MTITQWIELVFRWGHVIAAITWIGHALFFNWLDSSLDRPAEPDPDVEGDLWMVHSGGFYEVKKKYSAPASVLGRLHWFKWEAAFTWITGFCLLIVAYYMGVSAPIVSKLGPGVAHGIGFGSLIVGFGLYDLLWKSPLGKSSAGISSVISFAGLIGVTFLLSRVMDGRSAYIHVGALMGTCMVANVWMRIIPAQRSLINATKSGGKPDAKLAAAAKQRSRHNNYMTYPLIFIMVSNHYYNTYGGDLNWIILTAVMVGGAGVRHLMNLRRISYGTAAAIAAAALAAFVLTARQSRSGGEEEPKEFDEAKMEGRTGSGSDPRSGKPIDPATAGAIKGTVTFAGTPPEPKTLTLASGCSETGEAIDQPVAVSDGKLANVFVWVKSGLDGWQIPAPPGEPVQIDQHGCVYSPRVTGVQVGQEFHVLNSDPILHNVHVEVATNRGFNTGMPPKAKPLVKKFKKPEVMAHFKCDVHSWMTAFVGVVPHPFFAVSGTGGEFSIEGLPPGKYTIEAWHETLGKKTLEVSVPQDAPAQLAY